MIGSVQISIALHIHIHMHLLSERVAGTSGAGSILLIVALSLVIIPTYHISSTVHDNTTCCVQS